MKIDDFPKSCNHAVVLKINDLLSELYGTIDRKTSYMEICICSD